MPLGDLPDFRALNLLLDVARLGSFGAAARAHGISQQAVSERIRGLEGELKVTLFDRGPRGAVPTASGAEVIEAARSIMSISTELGDSLAARNDPTAPRVRVAVSQTVGEFYLPAWFAHLRSTRPGARIHVSAHNSEGVAQAVATGTVPLGFIESLHIPDVPGIASAQVFSHAVVGRDVLSVVVRPDHPWARKQTISAETLASTPLVIREEGSGTRTILEDALGEACGAQADALAVVTSPTAVKHMVVATGAPAVIPLVSVRAELRQRQLVAVQVSGVTFIRPLRALWRVGSRPRGAAAVMLDAARSRPARAA